MPNDCYNHLTLSHTDSSAIALVLRGLEEEKLLDTLVPSSENAFENIIRWGTKWEATHILFGSHGNYIHLEFCTANSPPSQFYYHASMLGYDIGATYCEPGMHSVGFWSNTEKKMIMLDWYDDDSLIPFSIKTLYEEHFETDEEEE